MKPKVREIIVVEGRYDKIAVLAAVDASVITTEGFGIFNDAEKRTFLKKLAAQRGVVALVDPDGAGFVIRNSLRGFLPRDQLKHAYVPEVPGKEKRKNSPSREGLLGVEGMAPETVLKALQDSGCTFLGEDVPDSRKGGITKAGLFALGLAGGPGSREKRLALQKKLGLPSHLTSNGLLEALNILFTPEELEKELAP